jgi:hypothetical protein
LDSSEFSTDGTNVTLNSPANAGDVVKIYSADAKDIDIDELNNVDIFSPQDGHILVYDAASMTWKNRPQLKENNDFDVSGSEDTFTIAGKEYKYIEVYTDGIRNRDTEYSWYLSSGDTVVVFNAPKNDGTWVLVVGSY